jgi:hypothetical protein
MSGLVLGCRKMESAMPEETKPERAGARISGEFRNGSLTAISVIVGFSLSFLSRWADTPGKWHTGDLFAVALIVAGSAAQIVALGAMLFVSSMMTSNYERAIRIFLIGLGLVAIGVAVALLGEIAGVGQGILGDSGRGRGPRAMSPTSSAIAPGR